MKIEESYQMWLAVTAALVVLVAAALVVLVAVALVAALAVVEVDRVDIADTCHPS